MPSPEQGLVVVLADMLLLVGRPVDELQGAVTMSTLNRFPLMGIVS
jgi:hypothetical protein